jgi:hypothetical protein
MTDTATELTREQRLAKRVEHLYATDPQFRAAASERRWPERPGARPHARRGFGLGPAR